ncbi:MAG: HAMP domain-containing histidine kinase [Desulfuromonadales bacterium]|nr:HAMP domain-containing histidine kinase [Desulfuromonadales bacterium]
MEQTVEALMDAPERKINEFCCSLVHDLKIPLTQISLSVQLLQQQAATEGTNGQLLTNIANACQRLSTQVESIRTLFHCPEEAMHPQLIDLTQLAQQVVQDLGSCTLRVVPTFVIHKGLTATGDPQLLRLVLINLLENAWKFSVHQTSPRIEFGQAVDRNGRQFFVRDNGPGLAASDLDQLFNPFCRLPADQGSAGTGIGLFLVRRIIELHGGRIWGESEEGGAKFCFTLP